MLQVRSSNCFFSEQIFREINAINSLKKAASSPFAVASRFAAMALKSLGESVPHKLSQQVALWTINDVKEWIKQVIYLIKKILAVFLTPPLDRLHRISGELREEQSGW